MSPQLRVGVLSSDDYGGVARAISQYVRHSRLSPQVFIAGRPAAPANSLSRLIGPGHFIPYHGHGAQLRWLVAHAHKYHALLLHKTSWALAWARFRALWPRGMRRPVAVAFVHDASHEADNPADRRAVRAFASADRVACVSQSLRQGLLSRGLPADRVEVVGCAAVEVPPLSPPVPAGSAPVLGTVCRMDTPDKDVGTMLAAVALLRAHGFPVGALVAGDGPCLTQWREEAARLAVPAQFLGAVPDAATALARIDLFVFSSRLREGLSLAVAEALAWRRPVIYASPGVPAELEGAVRPCRAGDPEALAEAARDLLTHPAAATQLSDNGWQKVLDRFDARIVVHGLDARVGDWVARGSGRSA